MSSTLPFKQVDVFTSVPFKGNPVAVVNCMDITSEEISNEKLQAIANWTNLSETTFLFKPTTDKFDYKLRIFTPLSELPFAGHPTIGSCKAFLEYTGKKSATKILQECEIGIVELTIGGEGKISFKAAKADIEEIPEEAIEGYKNSLNVQYIAMPKLLQVGPKWVVYLTSDSDACFDADPNFALITEVSKRFGHTGIIFAGPKKEGSKTEFEMRAFAPCEGVQEDPVCGSGSIALVRYLQSLYNFQQTTNISITQGGRMGRNGHIECCIRIGADGIATYSSGGNAVTVINGSITL